MGLVIYLFGAAGLVLLVGWAVYVLPTPGPLGPASLAVALIPAFLIMSAVAAVATLVWLLLLLTRWLLQMWRR